MSNNIEQQLAHLRWKKSQNEKAIRDALESTKILKQKDLILGLSADQKVDRSSWMSQVLRDELSRPLIISDEDIIKNQIDDSRKKDRFIKYSSKQLENIDKLSDSIANKNCRTEDGKLIQKTQLQQLKVIKKKLKSNLTRIETSTPYVNIGDFEESF